jgi:ubiquinone/menaquinone biosynthesis C-methylase UbiE
MNDSPRGKYWDAVSGSWEHRRQRLWRRHSDAVNRLLLKQWLPADGFDSVLKTDLFDEMCGDGLFPALGSAARRVVGMDISPAVLDKARQRHPGISCVAADVLHLPFADGSFDCIVSNSTLDHFESGDAIAESLSEMHRVLRRGGQITLTMDNPTNPLVALRNGLPFRFLNRLGITPYYVGATCTAGELRRLLERTGFAVQDETTVMHCPRVLAVALAWLFDKFAHSSLHRCFLRGLLSFECLRRLPTARLTGHFVAVRATKVVDVSTRQRSD